MMASSNHKAAPGGVPASLRQLDAKVRQAAAARAALPELRVSMSVTGGVAGERYDFRCDVSGDGRVACQMSCELFQREYKARPAKIPQATVVELLRKINVEEMARASESQPPIPPDSLVGRLEISDGQQTFATVFMADPEQARTAGYEIPPELRQLIDTIYDLAAKQMNAEHVRPNSKT
jgi:hypothetical protein